MSCCVALNTMCVSVANIFCSESIPMQTSYSINILGFIRKVTAINVYNNNNLLIYIALFTCNDQERITIIGFTRVYATRAIFM